MPGPKFFLLLSLLLLPDLCGSQQEFHPNFRRIPLEQGHINHVMRDSEGYIWISTQDGLTKYNGAHWIQFNPDRRDSTSISNNYVWLTCEGPNGHIWVGTFGGGLCKYDKKQDRFTTFDTGRGPASNGIRIIQKYGDEHLIVGTDNGLYLFNTKKEAYESDSVFLQRQYALGWEHSHFICPITEHVYLVSGENGAYLTDFSKRTVEPMRFDAIDAALVGCIAAYKEDYLIADDHGVYLASFDADRQAFSAEAYFFVAERAGITDLMPIGDGLIFVGANSGAFTIDLKKAHVQFHPNADPNTDNGLKDKVIYDIAEIEEDLYWLGTKTSMYEFSARAERFRHIKSERICDSAILGMMEDDANNLWIATRQGLARIKGINQPPERWEYFCYDANNVPGLRNEYILNVMVIYDELWLGYRRMGLARFEVDAQDRVRLLSVPSELDALTRSVSVSEMQTDSKGHVWVTTSGNGVIKWDKTEETFHHFKGARDGLPGLSHSYAFALEEARPGRMSIATAEGISVVDIDNHQIDVFLHDATDTTTLSGNYVMDFHKDSRGIIWVCTSAGLNQWHDDDTFTSWSRRDGLPNDVIYGMESSGDERWISSNKGLTRVTDGADGRPVFRSYTVSDGVLNDEHNQFAFYQSRSGLYFFGGKKGVTWFDAQRISNNTVAANPVFERFYLFNERADHLLDGHINYIEQLTLDHDQNFISFDLAALSYRKAMQNQFQYRMAGLNDDWMPLGQRNYVSFNGLTPGKYTLQIKASNNDKVWSTSVSSLDIHIREALWNRWYAWLAYALALGALIAWIYRIRISGIRNVARAKEEERKKIRERSARDFHDEAGTVITKLSLLTQYLRHQLGQERSDLSAIRQIEENIQKLRSGMRDFIWVLDPNKDSLDSTIQRLNEMGNDLFEHSDVRFTLERKKDLDGSTLLNSNQRRQLLLIMKEGMHNVLKHAQASSCKLTIDQSGPGLQLRLIDDGVGFDPGKTYDGHGLKNLVDRARKINSSLAIRPNPKGGTILDCQLAIHPNGS